MEVLTQLQTLLNNGYSASVAVVAIITLFLKILTQLSRAMDWHDKHFVRKRLSRLKDIQSGSTSPELTRYLDSAIELEAFRIASGVSTSRSKMEYLLQLNQSGRWSPTQLRSLSKFLAMEPQNDAPVLSVSLLDSVSACVSGISTFCTLALGVGYLTSLVLTGAPLMWLLGLVMYGLSLLFARFLATDFIDYVIVRRTQRYLSTLPRTDA